jgi:hypothetical protein
MCALQRPARATRFSGFFCDSLEKAPAGFRDFSHSPVECPRVDLGRLAKAADLPDKLQRCRVQLLVSSHLAWLAQYFNTSAHVPMIAQNAPGGETS